MSDAVRTYTAPRRTAAATSRRRRASRGCAIPFALLIPIVVVLAIYAVWISRDSTTLAAHLPKQHRLRIVVSDVLGHRQEIADSGIWHALPLDDDLAQIPDMLTRDIEVPPWVLNNIIGSQCFLSGDTIGDGHELLFVTKMHRLGVLIERAYRWFGEAEYDAAGGLSLRHLTQPDLHYAVRGRVLLVSPSRRTLIHALTLSDAEALTPDDVNQITIDLANQQVGGIIEFHENDTYTDTLAFLRFGIRFDPTEAHAKFEAGLSGIATSEISALLEGVEPQTLRMPIDGMAALSAHLGKPIEEVWLKIGAMTGYPLFSRAQWNEWSTLDEGEQPGIAYTLTQLLGGAGPGFQCTWRGIDPYEIVPAPQIVVTAEFSDEAAERVRTAFPPPPQEVPAYAPYPRFDADTGIVTYPIFGGPSLQPTAVIAADTILVSSSRAIAEPYIVTPPVNEPLPLPGNLYIRIRPIDCVNALAEAGQQFVDIGVLKGYTQESYRAAAAQWRQSAERIEECSALFSHQNGLIQGEIRILSN